MPIIPVSSKVPLQNGNRRPLSQLNSINERNRSIPLSQPYVGASKKPVVLVSNVPIPNYNRTPSSSLNVSAINKPAVLHLSRSNVSAGKPAVLVSKVPLSNYNRTPLSSSNVNGSNKPAVLHLSQPNVGASKKPAVLVSKVSLSNHNRTSLSPLNSTSNKPTVLFLKPDGRQAHLAHENSTVSSLPKGLNNLSSALQTSDSSEHVAYACGTLPPLPKGLWLSSALQASHGSEQVKRKSLSLKKNSVNINSPSVKILKALQAPESLSSGIPTLSLTQSTDASVPPCNSTSDHTTLKAVQINTPVRKNLSSSNTTVSLPSASSLQQPENSEDNKSLQCLLNDTLPPDYSHEVLSVIPMHIYRDECHDAMYEAIIRVNISTREEALRWLADYQDCSFTDWRVRRTFKENSNKIIFKKAYRCHNNTLAQNRPGTKQAHKKHTERQAFLTLTIKNPEMLRSKDKHLKTHPMEIIIQHCHNHALQAVDSLCHRRPKPEVEKKFHIMFSNNHSPSSALKTHLYDIRVQYPDNWFEIMADTSECPSQRWCYHQYYKQFQKAYGAPDGEAMLTSLSEAIEKYNKECGSTCAAMKRLGNDLIVVLCSPLMKRVHEKLKSSEEMGFLDSGGCMDRQNTRIFTFLAPSVAGALPTGIIMTSSESEDVILEAINLLKSIFPVKSFYGNNMPKIMMTDDQTSERNALRRAFPGVILLLCLFHVLQAFWRYVWDSKHKVPAEDRVEVHFLFKDWCYIDDRDRFEQMYKDILNHPKIKSNANLVKQITGYYERKEEWALCFRTDLLLRGNNTNNYSERTIKGYKDDVLERVKAYSIVQLFDFFTSRLAAFFELRIAAVLNNRKTNYTQSKHFIDPKKLIPLECSKSSEFEGLYSVSNKESGGKYFVDMELEVCSCPVGFNGAPCKHQMAVVKHFNLSSTQFLPFHDEQTKLALHSIMSTTAPRPGWYAPLKLGSRSTTVSADPEVVEAADENNLSQDTLSHASEQSNIFLPETAGNPAAETPNQDQVDQGLAAWNSIHSYVVDCLKKRPDTFLPAVLKFCDRFEKAKSLSENSLISALHMFHETYSARASKKGRYILVLFDVSPI
ncbi:Hydroxylamine reductase [Frankliniella fusca]|uniref:Hydroxylamine reductase n=1 Tax=Frankliniella fusca TaxID=407009 RepID=A0AAE1I4L3_9NEOP|nr:Hydroxylamine reductase [Frankliniella fusca]